MFCETLNVRVSRHFKGGLCLLCRGCSGQQNCKAWNLTIPVSIVRPHWRLDWLVHELNQALTAGVRERFLRRSRLSYFPKSLWLQLRKSPCCMWSDSSASDTEVIKNNLKSKPMFVFFVPWYYIYLYQHLLLKRLQILVFQTHTDTYFACHDLLLAENIRKWKQKFWYFVSYIVISNPNDTATKNIYCIYCSCSLFSPPVIIITQHTLRVTQKHIKLQKKNALKFSFVYSVLSIQT